MKKISSEKEYNDCLLSEAYEAFGKVGKWLRDALEYDIDREVENNIEDYFAGMEDLKSFMESFQDTRTPSPNTASYDGPVVGASPQKGAPSTVEFIPSPSPDAIKQAFMAGQADCGVDPSWSSACAYAEDNSEPSPDRQLTTKEALESVDMEKVGMEANIGQLNVILKANDMLLDEALALLSAAQSVYVECSDRDMDWVNRRGQTLSAIKQALGERE